MKYKQYQRGASLEIIILAIVIVGLVGALGWVLYTNFIAKDTTNPNSLSNTSSVTTLERFKQDISTQLQSGDNSLVAFPPEGEISGDQVGFRIIDEPDLAVLELEGYDFLVKPTEGMKLDVVVPEEIQANVAAVTQQKSAAYDKMIAALEQGGLKQKGTQAAPIQGANPWVKYGNDEIECLAAKPGEEATASALACATREAYQESAEKAKPFYDTLVREGKAPEFKGSVVNVNEVKKSKTQGYQIAKVEAKDAQLFFSKYESGEWSLVGSAKKTAWTYLPCSSVTTDAQKEAFKGEPCTDKDGNVSRI